MSQNLYKTASGKLLLDIDALRLVNEDVVAVGNMNVNARGDRVSPNGTVIETRNQIMSKRYNYNTTVVSGFNSPASSTNTSTEAPSDTTVNDVASEDTTSVNAAPAPQNLRGTLAAAVAAPASVPNINGDLTSIEQPIQKLKRI